MSKIKIRSMMKADIAIISQYISNLGWGSKAETLNMYLLEQNTGKRDVFIAEYDREIAAYVTIKWETNYKPFRENNVPEIKDLFTLLEFRNKGIASILMDKAEARIKEKGYKTIGLGVGLYSDYGTAQRMYVKRGYNFDGRGLTYKGETVIPGNDVFVDDDLGVFLIKEI